MATRVTGEVTVACVPSAVRYFLPAVLRKYHETWPRIVVRLIDEGANEVLNLIVRNEADFGLNYIGTQEPDVEFEPVLKEPFVVACPPDHPLARKRKVTWAELGQYDYMTVGKASGNRMLLDLALTDVPDRPQWYCEVRHVSTLVEPGGSRARRGGGTPAGHAAGQASHADQRAAGGAHRLAYRGADPAARPVPVAGGAATV